MAPTEILAEQHFAEHLAAAAGVAVPRRAADRRDAAAAARRDAARRDRGGQRCTWSSARTRWSRATCAFERLGLVVIDEQHRFGVLQRATLRAKGLRPDVLVMTATPIPRTLALTLYGDLDVSVIRDLPPGRLPVRTIAKPESRRDEIYALRPRAARRRPAGLRRLSARRGVGEDRSQGGDRDGRSPRAGGVSGVPRRPAARPAEGRTRKERVMKAFAAGELQVLVSTTVVEVGVDVPNASVMIVEHAERFGLSQLHQLRGRVGRERAPVVLLPAVSGAAVRGGARAAEGDDRHDRRLRDRRARPAAARPGRFLRHAPGRACRRSG